MERASGSTAWAILRALVVLAGISILSCTRSAAAEGGSAAAQPFAPVRSRIEQLVEEDKVPSMAVAVAREGEILWERGFGLADREGGCPATEHTSYALASISKSLTATALMVLVQRQLIDLDAPVNDYLEEIKVRARVGDAGKATVRRVASHGRASAPRPALL